MIKKVSKKWLHEYFGIDISELNQKLEDEFGKTNIPIYQYDGGRGTWDFDRPEYGDWLMVYQSNSKTYYAIKK